MTLKKQIKARSSASFFKQLTDWIRDRRTDILKNIHRWTIKKDHIETELSPCERQGTGKRTRAATSSSPPLLPSSPLTPCDVSDAIR
ncbi:hypothetical protein RUM43_011452 [Polyplax serrata]|uniref:Uncharacterized protein n=1 Tax=Polyplax serrata TaxID=468196 RepID=A0AAN8NTS0_POLSC